MYMTEVKLKKGESVDKALRRLKKKLDREGTLRDARQRRNHEKPSERKRRKAKEPKINYWGNFSL
jgi:small subunit ribosomal protein S21